jgi:tetratricopeptide (TPR) repeat protein
MIQKHNHFFMLALALPIVLMVTSCSPTDSVAEFKAGVNFVEQGDYPSALEKASICLRVDRDDIEAIKLHALSAFSYESGEKERTSAINNMKRAATSAGKNDFELHFLLGWAYLQNARFDDARQTLEYAQTIIPKELVPASTEYARLIYMLGICYAEHNLPKGLEYLKLLEKIPPYNTSQEYYATYARLAYKLKLYHDAIIWYKKAQAADKTQPHPYLNIAVIYDTIYQNPNQARLFYINALARFQQLDDSYYAKKIQNRLMTMAASDN